MGNAWEYKVMTLKKENAGLFSLTTVPDDSDASSLLNREGAEGWELVSVASHTPTTPLKLFFKRPR